MSAPECEFFINLPCPKCGALTFGAVLFRIGDMVATATDAKHFEHCGMKAQAQHEKNVERAYRQATGEEQ